MSIPLFMHLSTRGGSHPLFSLPPHTQVCDDDAAVRRGHKCMKTVLRCFFFFFLLKCLERFSRQRKQASGTTTAEGGKEEDEEEEKHAKGTSSNKLDSKSKMGLFLSACGAVGREVERRIFHPEIKFSHKKKKNATKNNYENKAAPRPTLTAEMFAAFTMTHKHSTRTHTHRRWRRWFQNFLGRGNKNQKNRK